MKMSEAVLLGMLAAGIGVSPVSGGTYGIEEKVLLENSISKQVENIVSKTLGNNNVLVLTTVQCNTTIKQEVEKVATDNGTVNDKGDILPGFPLYAPMTGNVIAQTIRLPAFVKSIAITIVVDTAVPDAKVANINEYVTGLLALNPTRGDRLEIRKISWGVDREERREFIKTTVLPYIPWALALLMLAVFMFGPLREFMKSMLRALEVFRVQAETRIISNREPGGREEAGAIRLTDGVAAADRGNSLPLPQQKAAGRNHFAFIDEQNIASLCYLLKSESSGKIAIVLAYLSPAYSEQVLNSLPDEVRIETLKNMAQMKQYSGDEVKSIEENLRERVNYLLGGPRYIVELINTYERSAREKLLSDLQRENPELVDAIRRQLVTVEDLGRLSKKQLYEVYQAAGGRRLAEVLAGTEADVKEYVLANLTEGASDMVRQEMELVASGISDVRLRQAKKEIIKVLKDIANA